MSTALAISGEPGLYERMQAAISHCYSIDDCREIATRAQAFAAYYKQINDDRAVREFMAIKLRAWRRIGEILAAVDTSDCETMSGKAGKVQKIRTSFADEPAVSAMSEHQIIQALKLVDVPHDFFETNVEEYNSVQSMVFGFETAKRREWEATPEGQADKKRREAEEKAWAAERKKQEAAQLAEQRKIEAEEAREEAKRTKEREKEAKYDEALRDGFGEVGVTMARPPKHERGPPAYQGAHPCHAKTGSVRSPPNYARDTASRTSDVVRRQWIQDRGLRS